MKNWLRAKSKFLIAGLCAFIALCLYTLFMPVVFDTKGYAFYIHPGMSKRAVLHELASENLLHLPYLFFLYAYPSHDAQIKTGEYLFPRWSTPFSIWHQVTTGTGLIYHPLAIIPGWTFAQLRTALANAQSLRHQTAAMTDQQIMEHLGNGSVSPEGEFYPETYYYTKGISDLVILKRAYDLMQNRLKDAWAQHDGSAPFKSEYDALIVASLIEKEAYLDSERPVIAGVIVNRLNHNMLLQIDAAVIYGLGSRYDGKIYKTELTEDTPYNTYVHYGLTPTPIAIPSQSSLDAAMHPQQNDYFYYVAKGDHSHQFSKTLDEHNAAVQAIANSQSGQQTAAPTMPAVTSH